MIIMTILSLLLSNTVTLRRDISILFNRIVIIALIYCILHDTMSLSIISKGVGLHGGLLHITNITKIFQIFIFLISILILQLTSFDPIKKFDIMRHPHSFTTRWPRSIGSLISFSSKQIVFILLGTLCACLLSANSGIISMSSDFFITKLYCIFHCSFILLVLVVADLSYRSSTTSLVGLHITAIIQSQVTDSIINPLYGHFNNIQIKLRMCQVWLSMGAILAHAIDDS